MRAAWTDDESAWPDGSELEARGAFGPVRSRRERVSRGRVWALVVAALAMLAILAADTITGAP